MHKKNNAPGGRANAAFHDIETPEPMPRPCFRWLLSCTLCLLTLTAAAQDLGQPAVKLNGSTAFSKIPKAHTAYDYKILWNGDLVYDGIETRSNVTGSANIREVRILIDERFFQLQQADAQYGICLSGTSQGVPGAANVNYDDQQICASVYNQKVGAILSSRADFRLVNKTNLVQGKLDEKIAQEFAQWYAKRKNWGLVATFNSPENEIFYGGKNPQNVEDALMLIDIASGVAAFVGADALFDGIGSYYAYVNGEYVLAATYGAAAAVPFFSSAVRRAVMDGGEYVLRTVKGSYVTRPKNVLGMNYLFEVRSNISHFMKVALDGKSFNKALQYKTDTKFIEALEDGLLADNQAIRAINEKPELVDEYHSFYTQTKGTLAEFLAKGGAKLLDDVALRNLTPEVPSGTFVNGTKFNNSALKIDPPVNSQLKQLADDVKLNGDVDIPGGSKTEQIQDILYTDAGYTKLDGKVGSNQGLDGLYIKGDVKNPTEIIVGEAKQWQSSGGIKLSDANPNTGLPVQMSDAWIQNVAGRLKQAGKGDVADMLLNPAFRNKISKYATVVDKTTGQINILKLGTY